MKNSRIPLTGKWNKCGRTVDIKLPVNILSTIIFFLILIIVASQGCASKRLTKQAGKFESEGLYEIAAENYLRSYNANPGNIDAAAGLRRTGQRTLDSKAAKVNQACFSGNDRETVYQYLNALAYYQKIRKTGIDLSMPEQARSCYEEARPRYLDKSFEEARLLLNEEDFSRAELIFAEINNIDPSYRDLGQFIRISRAEPLYREGVEFLKNGYYRRAYNIFTSLIDDHGPYKDVNALMEDALSKGLITVAISEFGNKSRQRNAHDIIRTRISAEIRNLNNPFLQVIDDRNIEAFLKEQEKAALIGSEIKIGRLMAAKTLLTGSLLELELKEGTLQHTEKRAYLKEVIETTDNVTREKSTKTVYHKVTYHEFQCENLASGSFQYQLSSTETGAVLASGVIELKPADRIHYAVFEGKAENLVPGYWEFRNKESSLDDIQDQRVMVRNLQNLLSARKTIKTPAVLRNEVMDGIAREVSRAVNKYNPEQ
jgi:tetratricopeptide (TPR) repeat protein